MTAPVDVLAVMTAASGAAAFERDEHAHHNKAASGWWDRQRLDLDEARAAVAELIAAAEGFRLAVSMRTHTTKARARLDAAIARVQGGAA